MPLERFISLPATIAVLYGLLLATYFLVALAVERFSRNIAAAKIQRDRSAPAEQIRRDRRQSLISLATIAGMFGTGHWAFVTLGWGFRPPSGVVGTIASLAASMVVFDTWFYWLHRLLHSRWFYLRIHRWHHMTVTPVTWSNNSDLIVDNLFLQSYWLVAHLVMPIAPAVLLLHKLFDQVTGGLGHSGFEFGGDICRPPLPFVAVTHHDQHHRFVRCNYATHFTWWDRLMGTLHPEHDAELDRNLVKTAQVRRAKAALPN